MPSVTNKRLYTTAPSALDSNPPEDEIKFHGYDRMFPKNTSNPYSGNGLSIRDNLANYVKDHPGPTSKMLSFQRILSTKDYQSESQMRFRQGRSERFRFVPDKSRSDIGFEDDDFSDDEVSNYVLSDYESSEDEGLWDSVSGSSMLERPILSKGPIEQALDKELDRLLSNANQTPFISFFWGSIYQAKAEKVADAIRRFDSPDREASISDAMADTESDLYKALNIHTSSRMFSYTSDNCGITRKPETRAVLHMKEAISDVCKQSISSFSSLKK